MKTESCISAANNTKILFLNKAENLRKVSVSLRYCSCTQGHFQLMLVSKGVSLTTVRQLEVTPTFYLNKSLYSHSQPAVAVAWKAQSHHHIGIYYNLDNQHTKLESTPKHTKLVLPKFFVQDIGMCSLEYGKFIFDRLYHSYNYIHTSKFFFFFLKANEKLTTVLITFPKLISNTTSPLI